MARHFKITIRVAYEEETVPHNMQEHLDRNIARCVDREDLLTDPDREAIVETFHVEVEEGIR